jgi:lipoate-protein ligase A
MALDHALAECVGDDRAVVRFYAWDPHTISFGRNEPTAGRYDREAARAAGLAFVRRPTGGRAVLHAHEVTYGVMVPVRALGGARAAYQRIHGGLVEGLRGLGVRAELAADGVVLAPDAGPCFRAPAPGEVVAGGRKLVGSAQVRLGGAILQHGSVILRGDQEALARLTGGEDDPSSPASIEKELGRSVGFVEVREALAEGLRLALGGRWAEGDYHPPEIRRADELEGERYARDSWTWRR